MQSLDKNIYKLKFAQYESRTQKRYTSFFNQNKLIEKPVNNLNCNYSSQDENINPNNLTEKNGTTSPQKYSNINNTRNVSSLLNPYINYVKFIHQNDNKNQNTNKIKSFQSSKIMENKSNYILSHNYNNNENNLIWKNLDNDNIKYNNFKKKYNNHKILIEFNNFFTHSHNESILNNNSQNLLNNKYNNTKFNNMNVNNTNANDYNRSYNQKFTFDRSFNDNKSYLNIYHEEKRENNNENRINNNTDKANRNLNINKCLDNVGFNKYKFPLTKSLNNSKRKKLEKENSRLLLKKYLIKKNITLNKNEINDIRKIENNYYNTIRNTKNISTIRAISNSNSNSNILFHRHSKSELNNSINQNEEIKTIKRNLKNKILMLVIYL